MMDQENHILRKIAYWERRLAIYRSRFHGNEGAMADFRRQDSHRKERYDYHYDRYNRGSMRRNNGY
tara:strand:+ start:100 stop:297 length:198 start_codon:yes stop_codon:yes gene_type:complete